jgi:hypothetical protein
MNLLISKHQSLHFQDTVLFKDCCNLCQVKVSTSNAELADVLGDNWLLTLDLVIKLDILLDGRLDWFRAHLLASSFELLDEGFVLRVTNEAKDESIRVEDKTLVLFFELLGKLWKEREVKSWRILLGLHSVQLGLFV